MSSSYRIQLNRYFDHAVLEAAATEDDVIRACQDARNFGFFGLCVNPCRVALASRELTGTDVKVCSVAGFPLGACLTEFKISEAVVSVHHGAAEIDMVANIGWLLESAYSRVAQEIRAVREALPFNVLLKVIIEAPLLSPEQQEAATGAVVDGGAQFVKTGTGSAGPATVEQVVRLRDTMTKRIKIKAAGGIRTVAQCLALIEAGASRLGSSSSVEIMTAFRKETARADESSSESNIS
jgi:deoxyribose-phosphate aldolase